MICRFVGLLFVFGYYNLLNAQSYFFQAKELFENNQYSSSSAYYELSLQTENLNLFQKQEAEIQIALCAYHQLREDSENLLSQVLDKYPFNPKKNLLLYSYVHLLFLKHDFDKLEPYLQDLDENEFPFAEKQEILFMKGYMAFQRKNYQNAAQYFAQIEEDNLKYEEAVYYQAVSYYRLNAYEKALPLFEKSEKSETYRLKVPIYILSCLLALDSPDLLEKGKQYIQANPAPEQQPAMAAMLGKAYFDKNQYEQALPFLEKGLELQPNDRGLAFRAGVAAQKLQYHEKAIAYFERTLNVEDTTAQLSAYYSAFSALALNQFEKARLLFRKASQGLSSEIKAEALFQFGKISCQLKEYKEALDALQFYLHHFENHKHVEEAKGLIGEALLYSGQFAEAIQFFEKSLTKDKRIQESFQRTCFYFGIQLAEKKQLDSAILYFKKAANLNVQEKLTLSSKFWVAEILYQQSKYIEAEKAYEDYIESHHSAEHEYYAQALAGYGWSIFQRKDYQAAIPAFQKALQMLNAKQNTDIYTDVVLRLGDCHFVLKEYEKASEYYTQILNKQLPSQDYAYLQNGLCLSRRGKYSQAIENFEQVIQKYPHSSFRPRALDEASEILIIWLSDYKKGAEYAQIFIQDYAQHPLIANAYLHLAIASYNSKDEKTATHYFKTVILEYGHYENQVATAFDALASILEPEELQKLKEQYQQKYPHSIKALESLTFNQARDKYYAEEYEDAIQKLTTYLETYPVGKNRNEALLMRGDCYEKRNQDEKALQDYQEVLNHQINPFTSQAIKNSALIYQKQKKYAVAEKLWLQLDSISSNYQDKVNAKFGLGELYLIQNKHNEAKKLFQDLVKSADISEYTKIRATVQLGKALIGLKEFEAAVPILKKVSSEVTNALGAEAQYLLTVIAFEQKNYDECRTQALVFRERFTGYNEWKAKAYYYLAQAYWLKKEHFQAIETLKSLLQVQDEPLKKQVQTLLEKYQKEYDAMEKSSVIQQNAQSDSIEKQKPTKIEVKEVRRTSPKQTNTSNSTQNKNAPQKDKTKK